MILRQLPRRLHGILSVTALALLAAGCKPKAAPTSDGLSSASPSVDQPSVEAGSTSRRPTADEVTTFLRSVVPPLVHVSNVKMDPPTRLPNSSPADNAWVFNVKVTLAPSEDLFGAPSAADAQAFAAVNAELDGLVRWHDAFVHSPYARFYPAFEVRDSVAPTPRLLARLHKANDPLPPVYGRMEATWQIDHWIFSPDLPEPPDPGQPRAAFTGPCLVQGSPEAQAFVAATRATIAQIQPAKMALDSRYAADVVKGTRPGTLYRGQLTYHGVVTPAEVRFVEAPNPDSQYAPFELHLPAMPSYVFAYSAKLARQMPIHPAAPTTAEGEPNPALTAADTERVPKGDLMVSFVRAVGKEGPLNDTVPVQLLSLMRHYDAPSNVTLSLLDHHLQGWLNGYSTDAAGFLLSTQQTP